MENTDPLPLLVFPCPLFCLFAWPIPLPRGPVVVHVLHWRGRAQSSPKGLLWPQALLPPELRLTSRFHTSRYKWNKGRTSGRGREVWTGIDWYQTAKPGSTVLPHQRTGLWITGGNTSEATKDPWLRTECPWGQRNMCTTNGPRGRSVGNANGLGKLGGQAGGKNIFQRYATDGGTRARTTLFYRTRRFQSREGRAAKLGRARAPKPRGKPPRTF